MLNKIFKTAKAEIKGGKSNPKIKGTVTFKETARGVLLTAKINGLPRTLGKCGGKFFGFHIHSGSACTGNAEDEFANVGAHYNPNNCYHPEHAGDLPPLLENNGHAYMSVLLDKFKLKDIIGKTVIIHGSSDDFKTQPSGNSGKKIACGVIK